MDHRSLIDEIASRADDFLAGAASRKEARAGIDELLNADYAQLGPAERRQVAEGVMRILENEGFFEFGSRGGRGGGADAESENGE